MELENQPYCVVLPVYKKPLSGQVLIDNRPCPMDYTASDLARTISLVLTDRIFAGNLTVKEIVALGRTSVYQLAWKAGAKKTLTKLNGHLK